ncbi:hypothetical protein OCV51_00725 [Faecalicatena acetigenes]|uniref:Nitric oxide reductase activation protein n=1 Tax=Faecalicatena acetigenes TaxID=2981790 RepID=A0ABT2T869_9FIRM|nr:MULTISPECIES: hypothetical protein [Lachnospiraceae]MCU6746196.1 hypothetical protein [Faecalicatena acetigenes]SCH00768.1 Nitric oxide reductase activation protein [uncultured Clostridium sp.]
MEHHLQEEKRAKNIVWSAAGDYGFDPLYLAFDRTGTADVYLNIIIGLVYKWYEPAEIERLFISLGSGKKALYEGIFWLGLENAVYEKEVAKRPALQELRKEYAALNLKQLRKEGTSSLLLLLQKGRCCEILGQDLSLPAWEKDLLQALSYSASLSSLEIIKKTKEIYRIYFQYIPHSAPQKTGVYFLQKVLPAFYSLGRVHSGFVRIQTSAEKKTSPGPVGSLTRRFGILLQFTHPENTELSGQYIRACFGESIHSEHMLLKLEQVLCTGNHTGLHLYFTRGVLPPIAECPARVQKEVQTFRQETLRQKEQNIAYYKRSLPLHRSSILRLTERLSSVLHSLSPEDMSRSRSGLLDPSQIWRTLHLHDDRIFIKQEETICADFSIDLLLDASSSRKSCQESIAAQAYILAESLTRLHIPVQIYAYCSIRGCTVMRLYRTYEEKDQNQEIFSYTAAGNNRDGLALRGAAHLMKSSPCERRLLIMLSDASPCDDHAAKEGPFYRNKEYTDQIGIQDTAKEIRALRKQGIQVLGVFMGIEKDIPAAKEIFGRDFVKIRDISHFADSVGNMIVRSLLSS